MIESRAREPYDPPQVTRVRLAAEEMAVAACKSVRVGPPGTELCNRTGTFVNKAIGS